MVDREESTGLGWRSRPAASSCGPGQRSLVRTNPEPSIMAPRTSRRRPRDAAPGAAAAPLDLQAGLGDGVHAVQVALREQPAVGVGRQRPPSRVSPLRTNAPDPPRSHSPSPSRPMSTVLVKQS